MLRNNKKYFSFILCILLTTACKPKNTKSKINLQDQINNCFVLKPVKNDSQLYEPKDFEFTHDTVNNVLSQTIHNPSNVKFDSCMEFVTAFGRQMEIVINLNCISKLTNPDSSFLKEIFNETSENPRPIIDSVKFVRTYTKRIPQFGTASIFEYLFVNVSESDPHLMYILLEPQKEDDAGIGRDKKGFVICSDGLDWRDDVKTGLSIPLFTQMVRRNKEFFVALFYDGSRFIPIDHFKSDNWHE